MEGNNINEIVSIYYYLTFLIKHFFHVVYNTNTGENFTFLFYLRQSNNRWASKIIINKQ